MESEHERELHERFPEVEREVVVLDIPDAYSRGDPEVERLIEAGVESWFRTVD